MPFRILFVCTGNTCRSPFAEAFLRQRLGDETVEVTSAGTAGLEGLPASEGAVRVAAEHGVDLSSFHSSALTEERIRSADLILAMGPLHVAAVGERVPEAVGRLHLLRVYAGTGSGEQVGVPDPYGGDLETYREAFAEIRAAIEAALPRIKKDAGARRDAH